MSKNLRRSVIIFSLIILTSVTLGVAWHDGVYDITLISEINNGNVPEGTTVTIKGNITQVLIELMGNTLIITVNDGTGSLRFSQLESSPPVNSLVVVRGYVSSSHYLRNVSFLDTVWFFY